jgi:hypothetical protein
MVNPIIASIQGALQGVLGTKTVSGTTQNAFQKILSQPDFSGIATADQTAVSGAWTVIGTYTVPAQQRVAVGYGNPNQPENQGYIYVRLDCSGGQMLNASKLRITQENANGTLKYVVFETDLAELSGDLNDKNKKIALPEKVEFPLVAEDSKIKLEIYNNYDYDFTIDYDDVDNAIRIPITVYQ